MGVIVFYMCEDFWVSQTCVSVVTSSVVIIVKGWLRWLKRRREAIVGVLDV